MTWLSIDEAVEDLNSHIKVLKHKSNFYYQLVHYKKVTKIGTSRLDENNIKLEEEKVIDRGDFPKFVLKTDKLPPAIDEEAIIEIVSPVLKSGKYKWRGIYDGQSIPFYMKDKEFKDSVIDGGIQFKNGTFIECVLEINRKIDDLGEILISGYSVTTVIRKYDDTESFDTPQGKRYFRDKKARESQMTVFDFPTE